MFMEGFMLSLILFFWSILFLVFIKFFVVYFFVLFFSYLKVLLFCFFFECCFLEYFFYFFVSFFIVIFQSYFSLLVFFRRFEIFFRGGGFIRVEYSKFYCIVNVRVVFFKVVCFVILKLFGIYVYSVLGFFILND